MGNAVGIIGSGKPVILFDAHMDTVGIHDRNLWKIDPYKGSADNKFVYGRGAAENKGALASILYGVKAMKEAGLLPVPGTVIELNPRLKPSGRQSEGNPLWTNGR